MPSNQTMAGTPDPEAPIADFIIVATKTTAQPGTIVVATAPAKNPFKVAKKARNKIRGRLPAHRMTQFIKMTKKAAYAAGKAARLPTRCIAQSIKQTMKATNTAGKAVKGMSTLCPPPVVAAKTSSITKPADEGKRRSARIQNAKVNGTK